MKKVLLLTTFLTTTLLGLKAQVKFVNEFLNIGVGARAHGMFGSVVASSNDASAAFWNTASLTRLNAPLSVSVMHANWFGDIANFDYFTIAKRLGQDNKSYGAISFIRLGVDNISNTLNIVNPDGTIDLEKSTEFSAVDYAFLVSYARSVGKSDKLALGGNLKIIRRKVGEFGSAWGFGADFSMQYKISDKLSLGAMVRDITTTFNTWSFDLSEEEKEVFQSTGNEVPISSSEISLPRLIAGLAYQGQIGSQFSYLAELDANISSYGTQSGVLSGKNFSLEPSLGAELGYARRVYLRLGIGNLQRVLNEVNANKRDFEFQPNIGFGLVLGRLKLDYALANVGKISDSLASHIFSLNLDLAEKPASK
ncbi:MAG: PorV/PorQ family protein [Saprospiraceae bacterium]|nr:PorV/PorQ family protein [Saprospiraceae bacterium]MBK9689789.1 PorV/PorQ family protein [Saprospiraceae bacterium]